MSKKIFSDTTFKLRAKLITLSIISLFIGITEKIPHDFTIIGLKLSENDRTLGWFIFVATVIIFLYFLMRSFLEMEAYNRKEIIQNKTKDTRSKFSGMTKEEYYAPYDDNTYNEQRNSNQDIDSINQQNQIITEKFIRTHIKLKKWITYIFEFALPVILAMAGIYSLCSFLITPIK